MADYGHAAGGISLSQPHTSDDDSPDHSLPASKPSTVIKKTKNFHHHQLIMIKSSTPETAPRKPRGRPPGSKNKPKTPIVITRDSRSAMKPVILEISAGADIIDSIISFARRNQVGICLISSAGSVSHVTLRQPLSQAHSLSLHGPFHLLSLTGSYFSPPAPSSSSSSSSPRSSFGVTLAGAQGQVFGGIVAGKLTALSPVVVVAATFLNPSINSLPLFNEGDNHQDHHHHVDDHHDQQETKSNTETGAANESCSSVCKSMPVYTVANPTPISCQIPPDHDHHVMHWVPPSRPPF